jgi:subtilisin-like proprotein convertase family protein
MDLKVVLRSPSGTESVLHNYEGGQGPGGIYKTYTLTDFNLEPLEGNWTLKVSDNWYYDTGVLEEWSLKFTAVKDPGQPENNPPVADAGLDQNVEEKT